MNDFKIILYLCNWAPHTAYQTLQDNGYQIPPEIKMVRISCTGRITKALLLKAFEMGADGVALVGCSPGACRYGTGTVNAMNNTGDTQNILELMGSAPAGCALPPSCPTTPSPSDNFSSSSQRRSRPWVKARCCR